ncbi:MAG TPA: asparagine synthase (glutamine-hydrolyzing) [Pyrinomonadaceae bacterium]|nr:asparagine synthase (glutamine-hydrolyzing) [Pyrinomonadaceae bacterium]
MCGICGVIDWTDNPAAPALARRMTPTMTHRGPDHEGYLDGPAGRISLGMRRLSIIDIAGGHQPIFNQDGTIGVILNGEIYNFLQVRRQLEDRGHSFRTRSDSEVIAHAYEEWGADCVGRLQGMFAFAVYDRRGVGKGEAGGSLFIARDRLGIKPLYYYADANTFLFASEVRTLLASGLVTRQLSRDAVESYLLFGSVSEPMTLIEGVLSLPPGHQMTIACGARSDALRLERYWNIAGPSASNGHKRETDPKIAAQRVRGLLEESVRGHLIADVAVGVFLSSGIDSTALAALASREVSGVHTFTVAFPEDEFSEATIARRTAEKLGATHQEVMLTSDEMLANLGDAVGALDSPTIDGVNTYFVSASARGAGLKVALSGLGGDEVFGGYSTFRRTPRYQNVAAAGNAVPVGVRSAMATALAEVGGRFIGGDASRKLAALWQDSDSLPDPYFFGRLLFTPAQVGNLLREATRREPASLWWNWLTESAEQARQLDSFAAVSCLESQSYLVNTLLRDTDSMSMAHSLEVRVPFLDHPLVEFVTHLPQEVKLTKGVPKALLVAALEDVLPQEVVNQTKRGFTFPWEKWLRGPLKDSVDKGLGDLSPALQQVVDHENVQSVWQSYLDTKTTWSRPWSLYVLNEWTKKHVG